MTVENRIQTLLSFLYGSEQGEATWIRLAERLERFRRGHPDLQNRRPAEFGERDAFLITYADQFHRAGQPPLETLREFAQARLKGAFNGIHVLPFFPYSSDDGFSVIDYRQVDARLGDWDDVTRLGQDFRLAVDGVINHVSSRSAWFEAFRRDEAPYRDYFLIPDTDADLSAVARPRTTPLLTPVETAAGTRQVWTTFSADQIDLNYANPAVLLEIVDLLLFYAAQGVAIVRLDAIAYLWKTSGTSCIHLPQTHAVVQLLRAVFDRAAPSVLLLTETNVPHADNIRYFGRPNPETGLTDEAQMVYQFPLAPLALHSLTTGSARKLSEWAAGLRAPGPFFNFIASHDGIGLLPAQGLLTPAEIDALAQRALAHGGQVSYKANPDGSQSAYELNVTLFDALNDPRHPQPGLDRARFMAAQAMLLSLAGVPGIYAHSLFGSHNCQACFEQTGRARSINREKFELNALQAELDRPGSQAGEILERTLAWLKARQRPAFHPRGAQRVLEAGEAVFALERSAPQGDDRVVCLINVSSEAQTARLSVDGGSRPWRDLLSETAYAHGIQQVALQPYQVAWLVMDK